MCDENDGYVDLAPDFDQIGLHPSARLRVERGKGLVHQENARPCGERTSDGDALFHAAGKLVRIGVGELFKADEREPLTRLVIGGGSALAAFLQTEHHVLDHAQPGKQSVPLENHAEIGARPDDWPIVDEDDAGGRGLEAGEDADERRLAAAGRPNDAKKFAPMRHDIDVAQRDRRAAIRQAENLAEMPHGERDIARFQLVEAGADGRRPVEVGGIGGERAHASSFDQGNRRRPRNARTISVAEPTIPMTRIAA